MNLPKGLKYRHNQADLMGFGAKRFPMQQTACTFNLLKLRQTLVLFYSAAFRNPSPWRQSGASIHLLPPFFFGAFAKRNFERDRLCQKQLESSPLSLCQSPLLGALRLIARHNKPQVAQRLVLPQLQSRVATQAKSSQPASLVQLLARLSQQTKTEFRFSRHCAADAFNTSERCFAPSGRAAFCVSR